MYGRHNRWGAGFPGAGEWAACACDAGGPPPNREAAQPGHLLATAANHTLTFDFSLMVGCSPVL
jgi:hypothetical protein